MAKSGHRSSLEPPPPPSETMTATTTESTSLLGGAVENGGANAARYTGLLTTQPQQRDDDDDDGLTTTVRFFEEQQRQDDEEQARKRSHVVVRWAKAALVTAVVMAVIQLHGSSSSSSPLTFSNNNHDTSNEDTHDLFSPGHPTTAAMRLSSPLLASKNTPNNNNHHGGQQPKAAVTFQELAQTMVPIWHEKTCSALDKLTDTVAPNEVLEVRNTMMKFRDMLDLFSPVYPNTYNKTSDINDDDHDHENHDNDSDKKKKKKKTKEKSDQDDGKNDIDLWGSIREYVAEGCDAIAVFQGIDHVTTKEYTQDEVDHNRNMVLSWKRSFELLHQQYDIKGFLSSPTATGRYDHRVHESHVFWKHAKHRPSADTTATDAVNRLVEQQLDKSVNYVRHAMKHETVRVDGPHELYQNLREELRALIDEWELLGKVMVPTLNSSDVLPVIQDMDKARSTLGDMNDKWTEYHWYMETNTHNDAQQQLNDEIEQRWVQFRRWVEDSDFEASLKNFRKMIKKTGAAAAAANAI